MGTPRQEKKDKMKIKSKPAAKPAVARKPRTTRKCSSKAAAEKVVATKAEEKKDAEKSVTLTCRFEPGREVYAVGTFNNWLLWDKGRKMTDKKGDGVYSITMRLKPGRYEYKFFLVTGGRGDWAEDVLNADRVPNAMGTFNSVLVVK
jgi:1,4-alpha-glucan branching enzyme